MIIHLFGFLSIGMENMKLTVLKIINLAFVGLIYSGPSLADTRISGLQAEQIVSQGRILSFDAEFGDSFISRYYAVAFENRIYSCWEFFRYGLEVNWLCLLPDVD
ncbi:hypothetical protein LSUCC1028_00430 [Rhodobacterales bacterium LSUCC1028]|nr:hypothetical protein [Rhodobacterales bacterium LSUCC1028]